MLITLWLSATTMAVVSKFVLEPSGITLFFVSMVSGIFVLAYLLGQKRLGGIRRNFLGILYVVYFFLNFVLRGIVLSFSPGSIYASFIVNYDSLILAMFYALLGLGAFLLGFHLKKKSPRADRWGRFVFDRDFSTPGLYLFSLIGVISMFYLSLIAFSSTSLASTLSSIPSQIGYLGLFSIFILLYERKDMPISQFIWCILCLLIYASAYFIMGMRSVLFSMFLYALLYLLLTRGSVKQMLKEKSAWIMIVSAILLVITLFPVMSVYKGRTGSSFFSLSEEERLEEVVRIYREASTEEAAGLDNLLEDLSRRTGTGLDSLSILVSGTPGIWDFQYGRTLFLGLLAPIPRALWPDKPETNLEGEFYEDYMGYTRVSGRGASGYTTVGDLWLNFHIIGVIVGMFLYGLLMKLFQIFCIGNKLDTGRTAGIVFLIVAAPMLVDTTRAVSALQAELIGMSIIPLTCLLLISRRKVRVQPISA